jgi:hypothetical protein
MFAKVVCKTSNGLERKQAPKRRQSSNDEDERAPDTLIRAQQRGLRLRSRGRITVDSATGMQLLASARLMEKPVIS